MVSVNLSGICPHCCSKELEGYLFSHSCNKVVSISKVPLQSYYEGHLYCFCSLAAEIRKNKGPPVMNERER